MKEAAEALAVLRFPTYPGMPRAQRDLQCILKSFFSSGDKLAGRSARMYDLNMCSVLSKRNLRRRAQGGEEGCTRCRDVEMCWAGLGIGQPCSFLGLLNLNSSFCLLGHLVDFAQLDSFTWASKCTAFR